MAALLGAAPPAEAQVEGAPCKARELRGAQCATFPVALDHTAPAAAGSGRTLDLAFVRYLAQAERRGTVVFLAGGPGQAATPLAASVARGALRSLRRRYDLVFLDQRGTGQSAPLRCSVAPRGVFDIDDDAEPAEVAATVSACANELGDARRFFTTSETVQDLEDLRRALAVPQIIPLGVSYGGQVAGEYARRFPGSTQSLILDSTGPIEGGDALGALPALALPRVLREVCFPPGCERIMGAPQQLLEAAVERIGARGLAGRIVTPAGRRRTARIGVADVYSLVRSSDTDPALRTALPAALEAAGRGDADPLLRLASSGSTPGGEDEDEAVNEVRLLATDCVESRLPWSPTSDPSTRPALLEQALAADAARYAPFPVEAVAPHLTATLCLGWPSTPEPPAPSSTGPDVPVLVLGGREDLRTPLEDQRRAAAQFPNAKVVGVPGVGHSVLGSDLSGCAQDAVTAFLFGRKRLTCERVRLVPLALPVFGDLADLPGAAGNAPPRVKRTAVAVDLTIRDVLRQLAAYSIGGSSTAEDVEDRVVRLGGLRGGRLEVSASGVVLRAYEVVRGVRVTGRLRASGAGTLTVAGTGADGTLQLSRSGTFTGALDGTPVRYRPLPVAGAGTGR
jgi:pimeloyl-ACP methyl ester carboxylesterase